MGSSEVPLNFLRNSSPPPGSEVPFLEVPREEAVVSSLSHQQLSPTARSDISSCSSSGSSFNSLHGDLSCNNNSNGPIVPPFKFFGGHQIQDGLPSSRQPLLRPPVNMKLLAT